MLFPVDMSSKIDSRRKQLAKRCCMVFVFRPSSVWRWNASINERLSEASTAGQCHRNEIMRVCGGTVPFEKQRGCRMRHAIHDAAV